MNRHGLYSLGTSIGLLFIVSCGQKTPDSTVTRGNTQTVNADGSITTTTPGGQTTTTPPGTTKPTGTPPSAVIAKSKGFFDDKVLPLVKAAPCTDCHADPRIVVIQKGGLAPQDFNTMYNLLKDGTGANNNKLFNMMRGLEPHPGGAQCTTEAAPFCSVLQEWYRTVFGDGVLSLGRVNDISPSSGTISGWAGSSTAATSVFKARFFLDGESGKVAMLGEATANLEANDNNIDGPHGFAFKIPVVNVDNKPHKMYAYSVDAAGKETPMAGSPYSYTVFKPKGSAAAMNNYNAIFNGCNGACHAFTYETKWPSLVGGFGTAVWTATNNTLYNKFKSGQHGGPAYNGGMLTSAQAWFTEEFGPTPGQ